MTSRTLVWVICGGSMVASAAFGVVACSSSPTPFDNTVLPGSDASKDTSANNPDTAGNDSAPPQDDGGGSCTNPPKLFPPSSKGLYCPYSKSGDAGTTAYCTVGSQVCCISSVDAGTPSTCVSGSCAPGEASWACSAPEECTGGGQVCCLTSGPVGPDPKCVPYQKTKGFNNTRCTTAQACSGLIDAGKYQDNQYIVCTKQADCATGTCTAIKTIGTSIGVCL